MTTIELRSPLRGWVCGLSETPDAVFGERMLGDGVAIDPLGSALHAPCDGVVVSAASTGHAVTVRAANGAEVLMHVGLETVALGGAGFEVHVRAGQVVAAGERLISFDLDALALRARSLITPIVVTNGEQFSILRRAQDRAAEVGDFLMELAPVAAGAGPDAAEDQSQDQIQGEEAAAELVVPLAHGIHARPAARIAQLAGGFAAELALVTADGRRAGARSPIGLLSLAIGHGQPIRVVGRGPDAAAAVAAVAALIEGGMGEAGEPASESPPSAPVAPPAAPAEPGLLRGVSAAPGLAIGQAARLVTAQLTVVEAGAGIDVERAALAAALDQVRGRLEAAAAGGQAARQAILRAHLAFLDDPELAAAAQRLIDTGKSAGFAWRGAVGGYVAALQGLGDRRLAERVDDLVDLERQVLAALAGPGEAEAAPALPLGAILLADELLPSQLMGLEPGQVAGLCTARGGPTSHVAILAAAMGLPAVVAAGPGVLAIADGTALILDAEAATLRVGPDAAALAAAQSAIAARHERRAAAQAAAHQDCATADGVRIEVFGNVGSLADARAAAAHGAEGCGLLRTEFLFLERQTPPDEDEQARQYQAIADALAGKPLIIRTLDVGGDKAAPYLPIPAEDNPALGLRGVRVSLWRPHLLKTQLRAILRVQPQGQCKIMVPMVASLEELRAVRAVLDEAQRELGITGKVQLGVMIETPAAAVTADLLAAEADFLSIGTNDLTQYVLAMDRGNPEVAAGIDALHPAVLRLIAQTCAGAARHGRWVGVCGGLASDLAAAPVLVGLGVTELSATAASLAEVKALVRTLEVPACQALARQVLDLSSPQAVRQACAAFLSNLSQAPFFQAGA
ncbi:phosphoenolpyruvate--protein phosphotransferase [Caulobacter sp. LARHSG274]